MRILALSFLFIPSKPIWVSNLETIERKINKIHMNISQNNLKISFKPSSLVIYQFKLGLCNKLVDKYLILGPLQGYHFTVFQQEK